MRKDSLPAQQSPGEEGEGGREGRWVVAFTGGGAMVVGRGQGRPEADETGFFAVAAVALMEREGREGGREGGREMW